MQISERILDSIPVVDVEGEVDLYNAIELKEILESYIKKQVFELVVNLKEVPFMDSSGIGTLVTIVYKLRKYHGDLKVANVAGSVAKVFQLTGMETHMGVYNSVEEAISAFKKS